ncbi:MAG: adenylate/guanylate cyclase domain-containing protein [Hyphomicrobiales bacterium]|nr:adenylate/guanylate cyclase domain-containing protein [Hyphomicrobiales bacterium]
MDSGMDGGGPSGAAVRAVNDWLTEQVLLDADLELLFNGFCRRLVDAGLPLFRVNMSLTALHPLFESMTFLWWRDGRRTTEHHQHGSRDQDTFRASPQNYMLRTQQMTLRRRLEGEGVVLDYPVLSDLAAQGVTDYYVQLTGFGPIEDAAQRMDGMVVSWTTDRPGGFTDGEIRTIRRMQSRLAVAAKLAKREMTARNVAAAYLGADAGRRVLDGQTARGSGETIHAVIWYSDLRGSTPMADRLPMDTFLAALNDYFECSAGAVRDHRGEVLRFVGDAVLAIFATRAFGSTAAAARAALAAARDAFARLDAVNARRAAAGDEVLAFGLGLHVGEVLFGNIGIPERLEFSVIGPAANEVARLEELTKDLARPVVVSRAFADLLDEDCEELGERRFRGVAEPQMVLAPALATTKP